MRNFNLFKSKKERIEKADKRRARQVKEREELELSSKKPTRVINLSKHNCTTCRKFREDDDGYPDYCVLLNDMVPNATPSRFGCSAWAPKPEDKEKDKK